MWIVRVALQRPYTFAVVALLILLASPVIILRTPTDIFPSIDIPVITVAWQFTGLNPEEMEGRLTTQFERVLTTTVDNIEHIESTTVTGQSMIKIFLQPNARLDTANAQVTAVSQTILRQLPPGTQPPLIINYSASTVPILQLALSGMSESELNDVGLNFLRTQLVTVPGASIPYPYGGKQRQVMVDLDPRLLQSKGISPADVVTAIGQQNIVLPSGTAKIGPFEYDVAMNASPRTVAELNDLPVKVVSNSTIYLRDVAHVRDGFAPQTNIVRRDGSRGTLVTILKSGTASTLDVVAGIRALLPLRDPDPPSGAQGPAAGRPVHLRAGGGERGDPRGAHRRLPHGLDDPALPRELAQHAHHRGVHSALDPDLGHHAQPARRDSQHHDARRARARRRHPRGRRHGGGRERQPQPGHGQTDHPGHPRRRAADRRARARLHAVHLHRVPADVLPRRCRPVSLRPARRGGDGRPARVRCAVAGARAPPRPVPAPATRRGGSAVAESAGPCATGVRTTIRAAAARVPGTAHETDRSARRLHPGVPGRLSRRLPADPPARRELLSRHR